MSAVFRARCMVLVVALTVAVAPVGAAGSGSVADDVARYGKYDRNLYFLTAAPRSPGVDAMGQCFETRKRALVDGLARRIASAPDQAALGEDVARCLAAADDEPWADELARELAAALEARGFEPEGLRARASRSFRGERLLSERERAARTLAGSGGLLEHLYVEEGDRAMVAEGLGTKASATFQAQTLRFFEQGELAFTFDDGPNTGGLTDDVLDALQAHGFKATFFQLGSSLSGSAAVARVAARIRDEGHDVGVHGWYHATQDGKPFTSLAATEVKRDLQRTYQVLAKTYGRAPLTFRAPYGEFRPQDFSILKELGLTYVGWDIDTNDWRKKTPDELATETIDQLRRQGRGVVLMHDIQARSAAAIETILAWARRNGYRGVTLRQKLEAAKASATAPEAGAAPEQDLVPLRICSTSDYELRIYRPDFIKGNETFSELRSTITELLNAGPGKWVHLKEVQGRYGFIRGLTGYPEGGRFAEVQESIDVLLGRRSAYPKTVSLMENPDEGLIQEFARRVNAGYAAPLTVRGRTDAFAEVDYMGPVTQEDVAALADSKTFEELDLSQRVPQLPIGFCIDGVSDVAILLLSLGLFETTPELLETPTRA